MKKKISFKTFLIFLFSLILLSCSNNSSIKDSRLYLEENWSYSPLGEPNPFIELPDNDLLHLSNLLENKAGYIFLKTNFTLPQHLKHKDLSIYLGRVKIAAKVYINGHLLGQSGFFPPHEFTEGEKSSQFKIPPEYIDFSKSNTLMICVWCNEYGTIKNTPFISTTDDVVYKTEFDNVINSKIYMIFSVVLLIVFLIYFFLFLLRRSEIENLSFSQMCFSTALYLVTFYIGEYSIIYKNSYSFLLFEKIFNGAAPLITCYFVINFTRDFLKYKESTTSKLFRFLVILLAISLPFFGPDLSTSRKLLRIGFYIMIVEFIFPTYILIEALKRKDPKAIRFILCFVPIYIMLLGQLFLHIILKRQSNILLLSIGWLIVIFLFLGMLIMNFVNLADRVEYVNKNLENLVEERTKDLEKEKERAVKEIELAAFVQQSFFKLDTNNLKDWDLQYYSKPMAGVSGDLYLAFKNNNKLEGIGIFDISGHGIASGLVTMLVKNIIEKEFHKGFSKPLEEVLEIINSRIITEKGNIENYLTGMLIRIKDDYLELVNAGHPKAILYKAEDDTIGFVEEDGINQFGAIGIDGFPVNSQSLKFKMESGDELILYTDGITEAENPDKKFFGTEGIIRVFNENKFKSTEHQVQEINEALLAFTESQTFDDDITYVILKKK